MYNSKEQEIAKFLIRLAVHVYGSWTFLDRLNVSLVSVNRKFGTSFKIYFEDSLLNVRKIIKDIAYDKTSITLGFTGSHGIEKIQLDPHRLKEQFDSMLKTSQREAWLKAHEMDPDVLDAPHLTIPDSHPQVSLF